MPEAVGSTFGGGLGGLVVVMLYLILGPGAVLYHTTRWAFDRHGRATRGQATLSPSQRDTIKRCLPWNVGITLLAAIPWLLDALGRDH